MLSLRNFLFCYDVCMQINLKLSTQFAKLIQRCRWHNAVQWKFSDVHRFYLCYCSGVESRQPIFQTGYVCTLQIIRCTNLNCFEIESYLCLLFFLIGRKAAKTRAKKPKARWPNAWLTFPTYCCIFDFAGKINKSCWCLHVLLSWNSVYTENV